MPVFPCGPDPSITKLLDALGLGDKDVVSIAIKIGCDEAVKCFVEFHPTAEQLSAVADAGVKPEIVDCTSEGIDGPLIVCQPRPAN